MFVNARAQVMKFATVLRKHHPEVDPKGDGAKKFFEKKHPAVVKAHLLLLGQTSREAGNVPEPLQQDFEYVVKTAPKVCTPECKFLE